ncbi:YibE/F family protein [Arthrobacter sp. 4R501]|uniref:YibE/F family protein n=1 Tax=Arthrobacter sp. 4R501 TaxID=2058886 RepID=UPI000CE2DFCB|nr:YibE/F family protein [Arthrobacter sp. 4R501]
MGHGQSHSPAEPAPSPQATALRRRANRLLLAVLVPLTLLTLAAMILMWPSGSRDGITLTNPTSGAPGATFESGKIQRVIQASCTQGASQDAQGQSGSDCTYAFTEPDKGGSQVKVIINPDVAKSHGIKAGDNISYLDLTSSPGAAANQATPQYIFVDFVRTVPILLLAILYSVVVIAVARWRGLRALIGLVGAFAVLAGFMLPGLVEGKPPLLLALVGSTVIMIGMLYFAHGFSARTSTALLGTMFGLGITAVLAAWSTDAANLWGAGSSEASVLSNISGNISISGIILCGLIISGLGVLNDVTIAQSSSVWELYELAPETSARNLFTSAMRIGRDHIASTVYTIAFAYAGAALPIMILVMLYDRPLGEALTSAEMSEEVVRTLVGSVGLVLAIPVTTALAVLVVKATGTKGPVQPAASKGHNRARNTDTATAPPEERDIRRPAPS